MRLHQILLHPTDVLFFRDGRPMSGSFAGHTAAWPLPDVTNHALHAALHRAGLVGVHKHAPGRSAQQRDHSEENRKKYGRVFGCLLTTGPFPVWLGRTGCQPVASGTSLDIPPTARWFFPRPKDTQINGNIAVTLRPVCSLTKDHDPWFGTSLPNLLEYAVANTQPPTKDIGGEPWFSSDAFNAYLRGDEDFKPEKPGEHFLHDFNLADTEQTIGIVIDPATGTTGHGDATGKIYSAHYLRLREEFRLGLFAEAMDKVNADPNNKRNLIADLLNYQPQSIIVGGQQRLCTALRADAPSPLPLPRGLTATPDFLRLPNGKFAVKWVLLTPAIWPEISSQKKDGSPQHPHPGGWLPNWIFHDWNAEKHEPRPSHRNGEVLLTTGPGVCKAKRKGGSTGSPIAARLVAAIVPKPLVVTGWALPNDIDRPEGGAKSTHLAVPAGAVYYFEAESDKSGGPGNAIALANALNWHGATDGTEIKNRRSTLLGEKGFGLGVCGTWQFY